MKGKLVENTKKKVRPIVLQFLLLHDPCLFGTWESHLRDRTITGETENNSFNVKIFEIKPFIYQFSELF